MCRGFYFRRNLIVTLGVAKGFIDIGLERLQSQRKVAINAVQQITEKIKTGFAQSSKSTDGFVQSVDGLNARIGGLNARLTGLRGKADEYKKSFDTSANATQKLGTSAEVLTNRFTAMRQRIDGAKATIKELGGAEDRTTQSSDRLATSLRTRLGVSFTGTTVAVRSFKEALIGVVKVEDTVLGKLQAIQGELLAISIGGAALSGFGLAAADNIRTLQIRFRELTGSQAKAEALMNQIAEAAQRVGLPVRQTQADFIGLVPAIRDAGGEIDDYLNLVSRLTLINPAEGTSGAIFAIREALSSGGTDLVSLAERFNLPRKALRDLIEETGSFSEALSIMLDKQGATTEAAEAQASSLRAAGARFRDVGQQALERGFLPYLDKAAAAFDVLGGLLESTPDGLLQVGAGATIAVTGIASLTLAVSQLLTSYANLQRAGFFTNFANVGKNIGKAGVLAGAGAVGVGAGIGIVRGIGAATGDERLQSFGIQDAANTAKQLLFLFVNTLIEGGRRIALAFNTIFQVLSNIPSVINLFRGKLEEAFGSLLIGFASMLDSIAGFVPQVADLAAQITAAGQGLAAQGQARQSDANQQIFGSGMEGNINAQFDEIQLAAARAFGAIPTEVEEAAQEATEKIQAFVKDGTEVIEQQNAAWLAGLQSRISFEQQYLELLREGTPEQVQDRIQALADEKTALEGVLPQLQAMAETSEDAADTLAEYSARLAEIDDQSTQLGTALLAATNRAMDALNNDIEALDSDFAQEVAKIEGERQKALNEAFTDLQKNLAELDADVLEKSKDLRAENIEALEEYQDNERKIIADHRQKVLDIERKSREDIVDAAARLDAAGVFSARNRRTEQLAEANQELVEQRAKNDEKLRETQENLSEEARELQAYYVQRRNELMVANQEEILQLNQKFNTELQTAQAAYDKERAQLQQHLSQLVGMRISAAAQERNAVQTGLRATQQAVGGFVNGLIGQANRLNGAIQKTPAVIKATGAGAGNSIRSSGSFGASSVTRAVAQPIRFHGGGNVVGDGMIMAKDKERVLSPQQNMNFERFIDAISGNGSNSTPAIPDNMTVDVTGVDSFEALVQRVTLRVIGVMHQKQIAG